jgi:hypothetical protein
MRGTSLCGRREFPQTFRSSSDNRLWNLPTLQRNFTGRSFSLHALLSNISSCRSTYPKGTVVPIKSVRRTKSVEYTDFRPWVK